MEGFDQRPRRGGEGDAHGRGWAARSCPGDPETRPPAAVANERVELHDSGDVQRLQRRLIECVGFPQIANRDVEMVEYFKLRASSL